MGVFGFAKSEVGCTDENNGVVPIINEKSHSFRVGFVASFSIILQLALLSCLSQYDPGVRK